VAALLILTAVLILAAAVQLRRERELTRLREDFVAGVSHEFRTPLAQIRLFAETLRLGRVRNQAERDRSLEIIEQETRRLNHLVENLLYVSRIARGVPTVSPEVRDVATELREAVEGFGPLAVARHARVEFQGPARLQGRADGDALRQIVLNLLDNAVKYGPAGQTVTVHLERRDGHLRLAVDDQGPGVPVPDRRRIFQRFFRLERDRDANTAGTGIGLALVQELAAQHGGRVWVETAPAGGARFIVEWPGVET
jgi:signal transduction histidine kinase